MDIWGPGVWGGGMEGMEGKCNSPSFFFSFV